MQRAEPGQHVLGAEPQRGRLARMELVARVTHHHQIVDRCAGRFEQRHGFGLGVIGVERHGFARAPAARGLFAGQHHAKRRLLVARAVFPDKIPSPDFEQARTGSAAIGIALGGRQQPGDERRAHGFHVLADRVVQHPQLRSVGEIFRVGSRQEGPGHRFVQPARGSGAAQLALHLLQRRGGWPGHALDARQRDALDLVEPVNADHFLDQIGRAFDIVAAQRAVNFPYAGLIDALNFGHVGNWVISGRIDMKFERFQDRALLVLRHIHPAEPCRQAGIERNDLRLVRRFAGAHYLCRRTAAGLHDQVGQ